MSETDRLLYAIGMERLFAELEQAYVGRALHVRPGLEGHIFQSGPTDDESEAWTALAFEPPLRIHWRGSAWRLIRAGRHGDATLLFDRKVTAVRLDRETGDLRIDAEEVRLDLLCCPGSHVEIHFPYDGEEAWAELNSGGCHFWDHGRPDKGVRDLVARSYWRANWLASIQAFADRETQRTKWLDPSHGNPHFSFDETMLHYFDDLAMREPTAYGAAVARGDASREEADAAAKFHATLSAFPYPESLKKRDRQVLADPAWEAVVTEAEVLQSRLLPKLKDPEEIHALTHPLGWVRDGKVFRQQDIGATIILP